MFTPIVPRGRPARATVLGLILLALVSGPARAAHVPDGFVDEWYTDVPIVEAVAFTFVPGGMRMLVAERLSGRIHLFVDGRMAATDPALIVPFVLGNSTERGLLGIAVDPRWPTHPYVYVQYTSILTRIRISRFRAKGDLEGLGDGVFTLDPASRHDVITNLPDSHGTHNAGTLRFGRDGMLYASLGDDGRHCDAPNIGHLVGKILRLRVSGIPDGPGGPPLRETLAPRDNPFAADPRTDARLVWASGLRNPFRFSVDPVSGDLFVGDVGEASFEELNHISTGGQDFGWPAFEGPAEALFCGPSSVESVAPIYSYDRTLFPSCSAIIAGAVYRSSGGRYAFPEEYAGDVFLSDGCEGFLRRLRQVDGVWSIAPPVPGQPDPENWARGYTGIVDWAVGPDGAMYYCVYTLDGRIGRIRPAAARPQPLAAPPGAPGTIAAAWSSPGRGPFHLEFALEHAVEARLEIFDLHGRRVRLLSAGERLDAGRHRRSWDARDERGGAAPAGIYFARLTLGGASTERRFVLVR